MSMRDEELERVLHELDSASQLMRTRRTAEFNEEDSKVRAQLAEIRRELAVYRAIVQMRGKLPLG